jgi:hypothetical protein
MPTQTINSLSKAQIEALRQFPKSGRIGPWLQPRDNEYNYTRTWDSLHKKGLISWDADANGWIAHWGCISERLYEQIFPGSFQRQLQAQLEVLKQLALDFSEGSNANFMRQITVVKNLRELVIKAEK